MSLDPPSYTEDDLLPISGLQHLAYCPRQFALIHIEQAWAENLYTAEGQLLHRRADRNEHESRGGVHIARALRLRSLRLGLSGIADVVEFHRISQGEGVELHGKPGRWQPFPVEYKRGRPKKGDMDQVQLCAQAICLEEMLGAVIPAGALFYGKTRRRKEVILDAALRTRTAELAERMHAIRRAGETPTAEEGPKCEQCSLRSLCLPQSGHYQRRVKSYLDELFE
jgi:CRISPR-associated exonuclease Cas4